jgi:hypothetical protein
MMKLAKIRIFWSVFLAFLVIILLFFKIVPTGRITYRQIWPRGLASGQGFLLDFKPSERLDSSIKKSLKIVADPVYFSLFTPRRFDQATITVKYHRQLNLETPIIEMGVLKDKVAGRYELRPLENRLLDELRYDWQRLSADGRPLVLQSVNNYQQVDTFLNDWQNNRLKNCVGLANACVAVYNYAVETKYSLANFKATSPISINQPLRGAHQFYVYFNGGSWRLNFNFVDLNQDVASDPIQVILSSNSSVVASQSLSDDNLKPTGTEEGRSLNLSGEKLVPGVYKVEVRTSDDIIIKDITSSAAKLAFINRIWPVSAPNGLIKIWTDGSYLQAQTTNPASLGPIAFGSSQVSLVAAYQQYSSSVLSDSTVREIQLKYDDIVLDNDGMFALSPDHFFNPGVKKIDRNFQVRDNIKYVVADYSEPTSLGEYRLASATFDLRDAWRENGRYTFLFSIPGLALDESQTTTSTEAYLEIKEIVIKLQGKTLWQKIFNRS